jgi:hypothetical protein
MTAPCTCGVKFTGGLCSSWCDSLRPAEPEPPAQPEDTLATWLPSGFLLKPWPGYKLTGPTLQAQPAAQTPGKPQATAAADGTHALDVVCQCGRFIVKISKSHHDGADWHGASVCTANLTPP